MMMLVRPSPSSSGSWLELSLSSSSYPFYEELPAATKVNTEDGCLGLAAFSVMTLLVRLSLSVFYFKFHPFTPFLLLWGSSPLIFSEEGVHLKRGGVGAGKMWMSSGKQPRNKRKEEKACNAKIPSPPSLQGFMLEDGNKFNIAHCCQLLSSMKDLSRVHDLPMMFVMWTWDDD
uniref:Uncharacterized protein n=1 Tax=Anthurium amnicola TaxID=1678845 RepID=A0A1D1ZB81_9ARAE